MEITQNTGSSQVNRQTRRILEECPAKTFKKDEIIYRQGDLANTFCYLKSGRVKVFMLSADGMEKTLNTAGGGELLGEGAFFDKQPRVSSAVALSDASVVMINKQMLTVLFEKHPRLAFELLEILANRIRLLSSQLDSMTFMQAEERIIAFLLQNQTDGRVKATHEEIAVAVGVSRVTVSKTLGRLAKQGVLSTAYGKVVICDTAKLMKEITAV